MRILIFSTAYFSLVGGAEIAVREITERLPDFEFVLLTAKLKPNLPDKEKVGRVQVIRVGSGSWFDKIRLWLTGWKIARKEGNFDLVWGIMASYGGLAALRFKKKNPKMRFLLTLQEGDSFAHIYRRAWFIWPWFKQIFTHADHVQAISNYLKTWAKKMGAKCPVDVVPNGVKIQSAAFQSKNNEVKRVFTVSRLVEKNGVEYLIRAMKLLNDSYNQPVVLKIVGDGELKNKLEKLTIHLNLRDRTCIFEGSLPYEQVYERLKQADVFVRPSLSEGLGNSFLEAMAMNVPVIGTKVGGIPDFLENGVTGWFCDPRNPQDIAKKIQYVLDEKNKEEVAEVVVEAQKMVREKYSWEVVTEQMNKIFTSLCVS